MESVRAKLNLKINDHEGVQLLRPLMQDGLVSFSEFTPKSNNFEMHVNRFAHEHAHKKKLRINSYIAIPTATAVHHKGLERDIEHLHLLTLDSKENHDQHYLYFIFAHNKTIRITMSEMMFRLWDFGEHWEAPMVNHGLNAHYAHNHNMYTRPALLHS
ncbi:MAG: DUF2948 family protein [Alphaproteobacteria bacterium]|nr:MAG: DUF2948 family protein [Alphaproteobacteria bacterium]